MKNIVVNDEYHQSDLKPSNFLGKYVSLLNQDVVSLLSKEKLISTDCPACASSQYAKSFERFGLVYKECTDCKSLYVALRPSDEVIARFYRQAPSKIFWRTQLLEASRNQRKAKIIKPRFEWIMDSTQEYIPEAKHWVDIHTSQQRYMEAMAAANFHQKTVLYPFSEGNVPKGISVLDKPWWQADLTDSADVVSLFETVDHTSDVQGLFRHIKKMLKKGGICFLTTILGSGFDVKELGEHAQNIYPPDRLNVLTVNGLKIIFEKHGFECLEFSTPGILDVDLVATALKENPAIEVSPFIRELVLHSSNDVKQSFQEFLQTNMLSSYGRILIRKA